jgi:Flp pilus assembly protein TadD
MSRVRTAVITGVICFALGVLAGALIVRGSRPAAVATPAAKTDPFEEAVSAGNHAMDQSRCNEAIAAYDRALAIRFDANVATDRGVCLRMMGERDRALTAFEFVLMREPKHFQARYNKAVVALELGQVERARTLAAELLAERPSDSAVKQLSAAVESTKPALP